MTDQPTCRVCGAPAECYNSSWLVAVNPNQIVQENMGGDGFAYIYCEPCELRTATSNRSWWRKLADWITGRARP